MNGSPRLGPETVHGTASEGRSGAHCFDVRAGLGVGVSVEGGLAGVLYAVHHPDVPSFPYTIEVAVVVMYGALLMRCPAHRTLEGEVGPGLPAFQPADEEEAGVWPACPSAPSFQADLPFLHTWLRLWVYGATWQEVHNRCADGNQKRGCFSRGMA